MPGSPRNNMRRGEQHARQGIIAAFKERNIGWTNFDMVRRTDNIYYPTRIAIHSRAL